MPDRPSSLETARIMHIRTLLQAEKDPTRFTALCEELTNLLDQKRHRFANDSPDPPRRAPENN